MADDTDDSQDQHRDMAAPSRDDPVAAEPLPLEDAEKATLMDQARQVIYQTPDVRRDKVASLKEAVEQGTYDIDSRRLANKIIAKLIVDS